MPEYHMPTCLCCAIQDFLLCQQTVRGSEFVDAIVKQSLLLLVGPELLLTKWVEGHRWARTGPLGVEVGNTSGVNEKEADEDQDLLRREVARWLLVLPLRNS